MKKKEEKSEEKGIFYFDQLGSIKVEDYVFFNLTNHLEYIM